VEFINIDEFKNKSGIYRIKQLSSGLSYIGQTKMNFIKRYWHHQWKLNNNVHDNNHLQHAWNKYTSSDFEFEVIQILDKNDDMDAQEIQTISFYDSYNNGFNMTTGGEGKKCCPMSEYAKKIVGDKNRKHMTGRKASKSTKLKMSKIRTGRKISDIHKKKLRQSRLGVKWSEDHKKMLSASHLGSKNVVSILNEDQVRQIKLMIIDGISNIEIANKFGVDSKVISSIRTRKVWNHVVVDGYDQYIESHRKIRSASISKDIANIIKIMLAEGNSDIDIAQKLNIKKRAVADIRLKRSFVAI
jgi:group I intron endonuclease